MTITDLCEMKPHGNPVMEPTTIKLRIYDGQISVLGEATLRYKANKEQQDITFKIKYCPGMQM